MSQGGVAYQGRNAKRQNSEKRRRAILEAALRIIVKDGVRGVRHRAVAKEADVPLSATTYYFSDIQELIRDAFALFIENSLENLFTPTLQMFLDGLDSLGPDTIKHPEKREKLLAMLNQVLTTYLYDSFEEKRDYRLIESTLINESIRDPSLRPTLALYRKKMHELIAQGAALLKLDNVELIPDVLMMVFYHLQYNLMLGEEFMSKEQADHIVRASLDHWVKLADAQ